MQDQYYYRYEDMRTTSGVIIILRQFLVIKTTKKGVWIQDYEKDCGKTFVLSDPNGKRRAYPTKEAAAVSFIRRKQIQLTIYKEKVGYLEQLLEKCQKTAVLTDNISDVKLSPFFL